jgi:hypothetical protein
MKRILLFLFSAILLFLGFDRNFLRLVPAEAFANFDKGSESLVIGRLVWTQQRGFFADGALLGTGDAPTPIIGDAEFDHQYKTYLADGEFETYMLYKSQSGGQAWFFSLLDTFSPFSASTNLRLFRIFTALLTALTLAALILWFDSQFGLVTALTVLLTSLLSQWLTLYGRNLFYSVWDYFLPMVVTLYLLDRESRGRVLSETRFYLTVGLLLFLKGFLSGYDFLLTPMGMAATALVYYALKDKWPLWQFTRRLLWTGLACALGIVGSFLVLAAQIGSVTGRFSDGLLHIVNTMGRRTFGTPLDPTQSEFFAAGQHASLTEVIQNIARKTAIVAGIRFTDVFLLFAVVTVIVLLVLFLRRTPPHPSPNSGNLERASEGLGQARALLITTWVSFASPLAWLVIFKAHAYYHPFTSAIIWHMPTMFFGYALCGLLLTLPFKRV